MVEEVDRCWQCGEPTAIVTVATREYNACAICDERFIADARQVRDDRREAMDAAERMIIRFASILFVVALAAIAAAWACKGFPLPFDADWR